MQEMCRGAKEKAAAAGTTCGSCQCLDDHWRLDTAKNGTNPLHSYDSRFSDSVQGKNIDRLLSSHRRSEG